MRTGSSRTETEIPEPAIGSILDISRDFFKGELSKNVAKDYNKVINSHYQSNPDPADSPAPPKVLYLTPKEKTIL